MDLVRVGSTDRSRRVFYDADTENNIICAFDYTAFCSPDCASCNILGTFSRVECVRNGQNDNRNYGEFMIGNLKENDNKGENKSSTE